MRRPTIVFTIGIASAALIAASAVFTAAANQPAEQLPPEKQALLRAAESFRAAAPRGDKANDPGRPAETQADTPPETGMLGELNAPISGTEFTPENAWSGWIDATTFTQVWAGAAPSDRGHGLVLIVRRQGKNQILDDTVEPVSTIVNAPAVGGPLKIIRVDGGDLIIANPGGREFRFNPVSGWFD